VLEKSEEELLALRNFGRKSYDELREKLDELGLLPIDRGEELIEAPPLDAEETPIIPPPAPEPLPQPELELAAPPSIEPAPAGRKKAAKPKGKAEAAAPDEGEDEEEPAWKRQLRQLTEETGEAQE